jgi:hypothetical protein
MISKVTVCPFLDTDHLAKCAEDGIEPIETTIMDIMAKLKAECPAISNQLVLLDDLYLAAVTAAQNATIRSTVCTFCNDLAQCRPTPNDQ